MIQLPAGFKPRDDFPKKSGGYTIILNDGNFYSARFYLDFGWQRIIPKHLRILGGSH